MVMVMAMAMAMNSQIISAHVEYTIDDVCLKTENQRF